MPAKIQTLPPGKIYGNVPMRVVVTSATEPKKRYQIKNSMLTAIDMAKTKITMAGAYFSDDDLVNALKKAAKRGVDVETIMPRKGDSKIYNTLNISTAKDFVANNVNVHFYEPRFSHIKASIIDNMTIVGSANPDARSFRENQELNVIVEDLEFQQNVYGRLFQNDFRQSSLENNESIKPQPLGKRIAATVYEIIDYYL
jgi:cardiolipin synthase